LFTYFFLTGEWLQSNAHALGSGGIALGGDSDAKHGE
jgi:hypothetical protein